MRATITPIYDHVRLLSLDVAMAALGGGLLAERVMRVRMPWSWYVVLPAAVWCVYTLDHLLDAHRVGANASSPRHRFHHRHFRPLAITCGVIGITAAALAITHLEPASIWLGIALAVAVLVHLALIKFVGHRASPWLMKEMGVGLIFTAGIWGLPAAHHALKLTLPVWLLMIQYFLLAMVNLIEFSWYEHHMDTIDGHTSFVRGIGPDRVPKLIAFMLLCIIALGAVALGQHLTRRVLWTEAIYSAMAAVLGLIMTKPTWFIDGERYRIWGDAAFLLPWLMLLS